MAPILPPEIWDHIIDFLESDYSTLLTCMLVCKSWEPRSRHNLPKYIVFENRDKVAQVAQDNGALWKGPKIAHILGGRGDERKPIPHLSTFAMMLAGRWTRVDELHIECAAWHAGDMRSRIFLHLSAFSITSLWLWAITFPSITTLRQLICSFQNLEALYCSHLSFPEHRAARPASAEWPQKLSWLDLSGSGASIVGIVNLLLASDIVSRLYCLKFRYQYIESLAHARASTSLQALVNTAGTSLRRFDLVWNVGSSQHRIDESAEVSAYPNLAPCSNLEKLTLILNDVYESSDYHIVFRYLSRVTSRFIRDLVFSFQLPMEGALPLDTAVTRIDTVVARICHHCAQLDYYLHYSDFFLHLADVTLDLSYLYNPIWEGKAMKLWPQVKYYMPRLLERGIRFKLQVNSKPITSSI